MAIDLEAIKKRVAELSGVKRTSSVQMWKPGLGEHKVRCLPWKNSPDGQPFAERWFYYIGENSGILAPHQFGKPDPINDLIRKLYSTGKPDDRLLAKKLAPKMRCYAPVIVRGEEDKGVQVWSFGKLVYQRMLSFFLDEEVGDILSPTEGFDLKVSISKVQGKQFNDTTVDPARRPSKLHEDTATAQKWLESIPNIDDMYRLKTTAEIESVLNNWLNGGSGVEVSQEGGATRGVAPADELDKLVAEVKSTPAADKKPAVKKAEKAEVKKQSLDDAFAELMDDE
jgi:gp32 DNA binding protein like